LKNGKETTGVKMFFMAHPDPESKLLFWPAKLGVTPKIQSGVSKKYPDGFIPVMIDENGEPLSGIRDLMDMIDPPPPVEGSQPDPAPSTGDFAQQVMEVREDLDKEVGEEGTTDVVDGVEERS
jgi:hypothetical protein